ncbi:MAG: beta strand repeat-containing protein [Panacagrimonas sp.]
MNTHTPRQTSRHTDRQAPRPKTIPTRKRLRSPGLGLLLSLCVAQPALAQTPDISLGDASVVESNAGTTTLNVPLTRSGNIGQNISLIYRTDGGGAPPATAGTDYDAIESATAVLPAGATMLNLPVSINGDIDVEPDEQFLVHLLSATNFGPTPDFGAQAPFSTGAVPHAVARADFNGDGRLDLAVANRDTNDVSVLLNTTAPGAAGASFAPAAMFGVGTDPVAVAVGDFNGDGRPDLVLANSNGNSVSVLINATAPGSVSASFAPVTTMGAGGSFPTAVAVGDFNGDGRPDLAVANTSSDSVRVFLNTTAPGSISASFVSGGSRSVGDFPLAISMGDFNGDGRLDLVVANTNSNTVSVLLNNTAPGAFSTNFALANFSVGTSPRSVAVGDINGDGRADLAVANSASDDVSVLLNTTPPGSVSANFAPATNFGGVDFPRSVAMGDINGDGRPDLAVANFATSNVSVLLNTTAAGASGASFAPAANFGVGIFPRSVVVGDFSGDGLLDLAVVNQTSNSVSVLLNSTAAGNNPFSFAVKADFGTGSGPFSATHADFNGDGRPDVAVANFTGDTISVLFNTAAPGASASFAAKTDFGVGDEPISITAADFNGDGRPDLAVLNRASDNISVLLNTTLLGDTAPSFAMAADFLVGDFSQSLTTADFNGDGRADLAVASSGISSASVLLNTTVSGDTAPSFAPKSDFGTGAGPRSIATADFNGDGRADLATANLSGGNVSVLLNTTAPGDTTASFATSTNITVGSSPISVVAVDLDGDGRPDLAVPRAAASSVRVLPNTTAAGAMLASFGGGSDFLAGNTPGKIIAADLTGDGRPDLFVGDSNRDGVAALRNVSAPGAPVSFAAQVKLDTNSAPYGLIAADLNGDGRIDLATSNISDTVSVLLNRLYPVTVSDNEATATILDDDAVQLSINDVTLVEGSGGGTTAFSFTVSLSQAASGTVTVGYATANDSATVADADYAAASGSLSFAPGDLSKTVTVQVNADTKFELNERFFVNLSNAVGTTIADGQGVGNISNDDTQPSVRFTQAASSVSEGVGAVNLAVELSNPSYQAVSFSVSGTPAPGTDYSGLTTGPITVAAGNTTATVSLTVTNDTLFEPDEVVTLALASPVSASLGSTSQHAMTIQDDDATALASLTLAPATATRLTLIQHCVTATAADSGGTRLPGLALSFTVTGANPGTATVSTSTVGTAQYCYTGINGGTDTINVSFTGSLGLKTATASVIFNKRNTGLTVTPVPAVIVTQGLQLRIILSPRATLKDSTTNTPIAGKTVSFKAGTTALCTAVTNSSGVATCQANVPNTLAGVLSLGYTGTYAGDGSYNASTGNGGILGLTLF